MDIRKFFVAAAMAVAAMPATAAPVAATPPSRGRVLILIPLTLTKIEDLDFGTIVSAPISGVVSIDATTGNRTIGGGISGVASASGHRAYFAGAGTPNQQVFVSVIAPAELTSTTNAADKVQVLAMPLEGSALKTINPVTRSFFFGVGGVILVGANQPDGAYEATFTVTANYL